MKKSVVAGKMYAGDDFDDDGQPEVAREDDEGGGHGCVQFLPCSVQL